jgi:protein-tyrosine phosphatase
MSYVDLHLHLLPGVDDGARTLEESLAHARRMTAEGVYEATVTPHVGHPWFPFATHEIPGRVSELQSALRAERIPLTLHAGGEIHARHLEVIGAEELDLVAHGPSGARWVLAEVPFEGIDDAFCAALERVRALGYGALIAHPERAAGFTPGGLELLRPAITAGALLQVNVCSLLGNNGAEAYAGAQMLVRSGLAFVLGSDGHPGTREHTVRLGFDLALRAGASTTQAWRLTQANPRFLLEHGIPAAPVRLPVPPTAGSARAGGGDRRRDLDRGVRRVLEAGRRR